jgi:ketosteroid isomerase-like protein
MSEENVEALKQGFEAFGRGDFTELIELLDADVEIDTEPDMPDHRRWHGHQGFMDYMDDIGEQWDDFQIDVDEFIDAGGKIVVVGTQRGVGKRSGVGLDEWPFAGLYELRAGKVIRIRLFHSKTDALKAAGLSE